MKLHESYRRGYRPECKACYAAKLNGDPTGCREHRAMSAGELERAIDRELSRGETARRLGIGYP